MIRGSRAPSRALAALGLLAASAATAGAQSIAGGTVLRIASGDSVPVAGTRVVLHRIARNTQGPVDSALTDAEGRFRFRFTADSASIYLASAQRGGIEYFSTPVRAGAGRPDTGLVITVADTSTTAPVSLEARHLVIGPAGADGSRSVLDLLVLRNAGERTRVAPDSLQPAWSGALLSGSVGLEIGSGEFSSSAVTRRDDQVLFFAPLPPGEKQLAAEYLLPADIRETSLALERGAALLNVLATEPGVQVTGGGIAFVDTQVIEGRSYRRWTGAAAPGAVVQIRFPRAPLWFGWLLPALVALAAGTLLLAALYALRDAPVAGGNPAAVADGLIARLAALDAEFAGRESLTPPEQWSGYQHERARLKTELSAALRQSSARR